MAKSVVDRLDDVESLGAPAELDAGVVGRTVAAALAEDIGVGDITSETAVPECVRVEARAVAREPGVLAGIEVFETTFRQVSPEVQTELPLPDGRSFDAGETLAVVDGIARSILAAERVALNFLQRMCGIATQTARYVEAVQGTGAAILDTRKTVPGLRIFDKYFSPRWRRREPPHGAVRCRAGKRQPYCGGGLAWRGRIARSTFSGRTRQIH